MLLHIGAFRLDEDSQQQTPWQRLAPRTRILCIILMILAIALTPNGHWATWFFYAAAIFALVLLSRVTLSTLGKRLIVEFAFIFVVLLGTLFRDGGQVLWRWGPLQITTLGLTILGSVTLKAALSLLLLNILTLTTSIPALLHALVALRVPPLLVSILAAMYRYLTVLIEEFTSMQQAAMSRNLTLGSPYHYRLVFGNLIGALFVRTYDRGERIYQAMLARGYTGLPPIHEAVAGGKQDLVALTLTAIVALIGQSFYLPALLD